MNYYQPSYYQLHKHWHQSKEECMYGPSIFTIELPQACWMSLFSRSNLLVKEQVFWGNIHHTQGLDQVVFKRRRNKNTNIKLWVDVSEKATTSPPPPHLFHLKICILSNNYNYLLIHSFKANITHANL
jgi:hypothetical protein